jgi:hypothetical protein
MTLESKINALVNLGDHIRSRPRELEEVVAKAGLENSWFTHSNSYQALDAIASEFLTRPRLESWLATYIPRKTMDKTVGIIAAGNIPLVCFHDLLACFVANTRAQIKLSQKDTALTTYMVEQLQAIEPASTPYFELIDRIKGIDAIIATGSDNSARYFEYYFGKYPHIIRKNRSSLAILSGDESDEELNAIGRDVFSYFGLGCRNVSALRVPMGYDFTRLLSNWKSYQGLLDHHSYRNNYDYNMAILLMNKVPFLAGDAILLVQDSQLASRLATLHYDYYTDQNQFIEELSGLLPSIQVIVSARSWTGIESLKPGESQRPGLADYADGANTLEFLARL